MRGRPESGWWCAIGRSTGDGWWDPRARPCLPFSIDGRAFQAADGRFATPLDARDGQLEVRVAAPGMLTRTVRAGATLSELGDIGLQPAPRIDGTVQLASGQPVAGAVVTAGPDTTRSGPNGAFALPIGEPPPRARPSSSMRPRGTWPAASR